MLMLFFVQIVQTNNNCCNPSLGLATKAKRVTRVRAKRSMKKCEDENSHSQVSSHFGSWSPGGLPNLQRAIAKVKPPRIEEFFISLESY
jgi:hypothetical protein